MNKEPFKRWAANMGPPGWQTTPRPSKTEDKPPDKKPVPENLQDDSMGQSQKPLNSTKNVLGLTPKDN